MDDRKCWELRSDCMMRNEQRENASCPAYRQGLSCWEVDWKVIVESLPASQQEYWHSFLEKCHDCLVYRTHPAEMQARIDDVNSIYPG